MPDANIEAARISPSQVRFGIPVAFLLFEESPNGRPAVVPNDGARGVGDFPVARQQFPTDVHVIPGRPMDRVELTFVLHPHLSIKAPRARTAEGWVALSRLPKVVAAALISKAAACGAGTYEHPLRSP